MVVAEKDSEDLFKATELDDDAQPSLPIPPGLSNKTALLTGQTDSSARKRQLQTSPRVQGALPVFESGAARVKRKCQRGRAAKWTWQSRQPLPLDLTAHAFKLPP